jgi:hypothetical protein
MPNSRPVAPDLLGVVQDYLANEVSPLLPPLHQFQLRIVQRLLETVRRELQLAPAADAAELERLCALLGHAGSLVELNAELARSIRDGAFAVDDRALLAHLRETIEDSLRINNPKWLPAAAAAP